MHMLNIGVKMTSTALARVGEACANGRGRARWKRRVPEEKDCRGAVPYCLPEWDWLKVAETGASD